MKFFSAAVTAIFASLFVETMGSPIDISASTQPNIEKRDTCTIRLDFIDSWTDSGLHRFRHAPSTSKSGVDLGDVLNKYWPYAASTGATKCSAIVNNRAAFEDPQHGWVIDENEVYGAAGNAAMDCITHNFMDGWRIDSGCIIEAGSIGS